MNSLHQFDGHWDFDLELPSFYLGEHNTSKINTALPVSFEDPRTADPDPSPEQIAALHFLQNNEKEIAPIVYNGLLEIYRLLRKKDFEDRGYDVSSWNDNFQLADSDPNKNEEFPLVKNTRELWDIVDICGVSIDLLHHEGLSYINFEAKIYGDEDKEQPFIVVLHETRLVLLWQNYLGDVFRADQNEVKDAEEIFSKSLKRSLYDPRKKPAEPTFYSPDPKYHVLRIWQETANSYYPYQLIELDRTDEFIEWYKAEQGEFAKRFKPDPAPILQTALRYNNEEFIRRFLNEYMPAPTFSIEWSVYHLKTDLAKELYDYSGKLNGDGNANRSLYKLFERIDLIFQEGGKQEELDKANTLLDWLFTLGERPIGPSWNDFHAFKNLEKKHYLQITEIIEAISLRHKFKRGSVALKPNSGSDDSTFLLQKSLVNIAGTRTNSPSFPGEARGYAAQLALIYLYASGFKPDPELFLTPLSQQLGSDIDEERILPFLKVLIQNYHPLEWRFIQLSQELPSENYNLPMITRKVEEQEFKKSKDREGILQVIRILRFFIPH